MSKEFVENVKQMSKEYKCEVLTAEQCTNREKPQFDEMLNAERIAKDPTIEVSKEVTFGVVNVVSKPHYVSNIEFNEEIPVVPMGCMVQHVMASSSGIEPVYSETYTRRKACSNIPPPNDYKPIYNTDIDILVPEQYGATCSKCHEYYEHAVASDNFQCWGCKNGY